MAIKQSSGYCHHCQQPRPFAKNTPNHILHFVLTLFTFGLWGVVWIVLAAKAAGSSALCTACGMAQGSGAPGKTTAAVASNAGQGQWAPGWYPDPDDGSQQRYWDGNKWTDHREPAAADATAPELGAAETEPTPVSPDRSSAAE